MGGGESKDSCVDKTSYLTLIFVILVPNCKLRGTRPQFALCFLQIWQNMDTHHESSNIKQVTTNYTLSTQLFKYEKGNLCSLTELFIISHSEVFT